jgi:hypothetical protein
MALNTTTLETNLNTKMNATTGTTEGKEFLLLGKAVEALTPSITVASVIAEGTTQVARVTTEGTTQVAAVQAAGSGYASLTGATFTGDIDMGSNDITTTGKVLYSNVYSALGDLPSASTYHGMFAHVHGTGKGYYAHGGNWIELVSLDTSGNLTVAGNLTVSGTTTTVNSTTLDVADLNITIASGAADAATANGAGLTVDGASATMLYTSATDTWDFNKAITGTYTNLQPVVDASNVTGSTTIDMRKPMHHLDMTGDTSFTGVSIAAGRTAMVVLDKSSSLHVPTWGNDIKWPAATEPTWSDHRYWIVSMTCLDGSIILASASGYTV